MKSNTTAGLVGFLLVLSSVNLPKADAKVQNTTNSSKPTIESRLGRITKVIREREKEAEASLNNDLDSFYMADSIFNNGSQGNHFLNYNLGFRNFNSGWGNNYSGWNNGGIFANGGNGFRNLNSGGQFINGSNSFRNYNPGGSNWPNESTGWRNAGTFVNSSPLFRNNYR